MNHPQLPLNRATISPAYGRDYQSADEALLALLAGKDFILHLPQYTTYCSLRDFTPTAEITIRYNKLKSVTVYRRANNARQGANDQ